jgi:hypothetical protein
MLSSGNNNFKSYANHPFYWCWEYNQPFETLAHIQHFCMSKECRRIHFRKIKLKYRRRKAGIQESEQDVNV